MSAVRTVTSLLAVPPGLSRILVILGSRVRAAFPALLFGLRLWAAVCLALFVAFKLELENPSWAGTTAALVCQPVLGASLRKGWFRLIGTMVGAVTAVALSAAFVNSRAGFLIGLAIWGGLCAFVATLLRNFAAYAAALAGFTTAIIAVDQLGAIGGANGDAFNFALARATEISTGIVCAGLVLATTDLGGTRRRLASLIAQLTAEIMDGLRHSLQIAGPVQADSRPVRRALLSRVSGLETVSDQAAGEIATLPFRPRLLQAAADGLTEAIIAWRSVSSYLEGAPKGEAEAVPVRKRLECLPPIAASDDPAVFRRALWNTARSLVAMPAETPSLRLLADRTASGLLGLDRGMTGVQALGNPASVPGPRRIARLRVPDVLPALINATRAFLTVGVASLFWIWTAWPGGGNFIVFATIAVTMFAPQEDAAYASVRSFTVGSALTAIVAAVIAFMLLPQLSTFAGLCAALGLVLVPFAAMMTQSWQPVMFTAATANFVPLLSPANLMTYDPGRYYNSAVAILAGVGLGMLAFRLVPPMPPEARARRLLALTLRDLRRLARGRLRLGETEWKALVYGRLSAMPGSVDRLQSARLAATLSLGTDMIRLRRSAQRFGLNPLLGEAMAAIDAGDSAATIQALHRFDAELAAVPEGQPGANPRLRARGTVLSAINSLRQFAPYFDTRVPR